MSNLLTAETEDWKEYPLWSDSTIYERTLVVDQKHPLASDSNGGSSEAPFKTIQAALDAVKPGERIRIREGKYREMLRPVRGGTGPDKMISIEAALGEEVIISGSRVVDLEWTRPAVWTEREGKDKLTPSYSRNVWVATLPESIFENGYQPFALKNIEDSDYALMPWTEPIEHTSPYTLRRGLVYQNKKRLTQVGVHGDLPRVEGSFWVDHDNKTLLIHPYGSGNPNEDLFEIAAQSHLLFPEKLGLGYIRLNGLTFEHCANGFLRASTGAVNTRGGHHWIIENNVIREVNSSGLEFGELAYEYKDPAPENQPIEIPKSERGHMIIRNNRIHDCGTAGMRSLHLRSSRIESNHIWNCGWQDAEMYFECAGIKLLVTRDTLVADNHIHDILGGTGIWMDWDIRQSRLTRNILHSIKTRQGAIFVEASTVPNLIDNNIIWDIDGMGMFLGESSNQIILHNLLGETSAFPFQMNKHTDRTQKNDPLISVNNHIAGNLIVNGGESRSDFKGNLLEQNLYIITREPASIDRDKWQQKGFDQSSQFIRASIRYEKGNRRLVWSGLNDVNQIERHPVQKTDFRGHLILKDEILPGPFPSMSQNLSKGFLLIE